jgi:hypothetical protein
MRQMATMIAREYVAGRTASHLSGALGMNEAWVVALLQGQGIFVDCSGLEGAQGNEHGEEAGSLRIGARCQADDFTRASWLPRSAGCFQGP